MNQTQKYNRRSIRLPEYDYSQAGAYFVTICAQNRICLFGEICDETMQLNDAGKMIERWWHELATKYEMVCTDSHIVMPNHFHGIIIINDPVKATQRGRPNTNDELPGQPRRVAPTLGAMVGWFKTMTTNEYIRGVKQHGWMRFAGKLWQRNYYERIIRDEDELNHVREYIMYNPVRWQYDRDNPDGCPDDMETKFWEQIT